MALGDVVRRWRLELGWAQKEVAARSGGRLSQVNVSDMELQRYPNPTQRTLEGFAAAFGVSLDALVAAASAPVDAIPSVAEALPRELAGLPGWVRDFHRWGAQLSPAQRQSILALARSLAEDTARTDGAEVAPEAEADPTSDQSSAQGR